MGDGNESQIHATAGLEAAERLHNSFWLVWMLRTNTDLAILKGEWKATQEFIARALAESPKDAFTLANGALLNLQVGNLEQSSEYIKQILEVVPDILVSAGLEHVFGAAAIPLFARVTGTPELLDVAESAARELLSSPSIPSVFISLTRVGLALIAIQRSDVESAKEQFSYLESYAGTQIFAISCNDRILGLLVQTIGNLDDAQTRFEDALAFTRKAGYRTELAWSLCDYADMLLLVYHSLCDG